MSLLTLADGRVSVLASGVTGTAGSSPDSTRLMLGQPETDAQGLTRLAWKAFPVSGGPPGATLRLPSQAIDLAWTPDGRGLSYRNRADANLNVYRQGEDGKPVQVTRFTEGRLTSHAWSPDGKRLALAVRADEGGNVWVTEADGSRPIQVTRLPSSAGFPTAGGSPSRPAS